MTHAQCGVYLIYDKITGEGIVTVVGGAALRKKMKVLEKEYNEGGVERRFDYRRLVLSHGDSVCNQFGGLINTRFAR